MTSAPPAAPASRPAPRPAPIRTDANAFALDTMSVRVPGIVRDVQSANPDLPPTSQRALDDLHAGLTGGLPVPMLALDPAPGPDYESWAAAYAAQEALDGPLTWLTGSWFFTETFVYRHLMQAIRWYETGRDPFLHHKQAELVHPRFAELLAAALDARGTVSGAGAAAERLPDLLLLDLWGNRADLSHPAGHLTGQATAPDDLLIDDRADALAALARGGTVHLVADNTGTELATDLVLIDALLAGGWNVALHVKPYPMFVSDTTIPDVWHTLAALDGMGAAASALTGRLRSAWGAGRLALAAHFFWASSRYWWDMPAPLRAALGQARLIIVKGDVNYRRMIGDGIWPDGATLATALAGFPAPVLALRSLKCDALVGVSAARQQQLDAIHPGWRPTGRYGVIQFAAAPTSEDRP